jgi:hypothetical protein
LYASANGFTTCTVQPPAPALSHHDHPIRRNQIRSCEKIFKLLIFIGKRGRTIKILPKKENMYKNLFKSICFASTSMLILSCGDELENSDQREIKQKVRFGGENDYSFHTQGNMIVSAGGFSLGNSDQDARWQSATATLASGHMISYSCIEGFAPDKCYTKTHHNCEYNTGTEEVPRATVSWSSGTITSGNRLVTTHHSIVGKKDNPTGKIEAFFGKSYLSDDKSKTTLTNNWLFYNRMYSLGFQELMPGSALSSTAEAVKLLQTWRYYPEKTYYTHNTPRDYDNAVLLAEPQRLNFVGLYEPTVFPYPGMFFGQIDMNPDTGIQPDTLPDFDVWSTHSNTYPDEIFNLRPSALSRSARFLFSGYKETITNGSRKCASIGEPESCIELSSGNYDHISTAYGDHCAYSSIDSIPGSSGGSVYTHEPSIFAGNSWYVNKGFYGIGIIQGGMDKHPQKETWSSFSDFNIPLNDYFAAVTSYHSQIYEDSSRNRGHDSELIPPGIIDFISEIDEERGEVIDQGTFYIPDGCDTTQDPKCQGNYNTQGTSVIGGNTQLPKKTIACNDLYWGYSERYDNDARIKQSYVVGIYGSRSELPDFRDKVDPNYIDKEPNLGTFGTICAPWSPRSWHFNWPELRFNGLRRPESRLRYREDVIDQDYEFIGSNLANNISTMYEIKEEDAFEAVEYVSFIEPGQNTYNSEDFSPAVAVTQPHDLLAPAPMLFCPPHYVVSGIGLVVRPCDDGDCRSDVLVRGVQYLMCSPRIYDLQVPYREQLLYSWTFSPSMSDVSHLPQFSDHYPVVGQGVNRFLFEVGKGKSTRVYQEIGHIYGYGINDSLEEIHCKDGHAISSIEINDIDNNLGISHPANKQVSNISIECVPLPAQ